MIFPCVHASERDTELVRKMTICASGAKTEKLKGKEYCHGSLVQNGQVLFTESRLMLVKFLQIYIYKLPTVIPCGGAYFESPTVVQTVKDLLVPLGLCPSLCKIQRPQHINGTVIYS